MEKEMAHDLLVVTNNDEKIDKKDAAHTSSKSSRHQHLSSIGARLFNQDLGLQSRPRVRLAAGRRKQGPQILRRQEEHQRVYWQLSFPSLFPLV
jgi:hypothetical protein